MSKPKITDEELEKEIAEGKSIPDIAAKYGMTPGGVRNKLTRLHKKERAEDPLYKTYGQQQAEKLKDQTKINPNNCLQTLLESEKIKTKQLLQKVKELEKENSSLRSGRARWIPIETALPPEPEEDKALEYIVQIQGFNLPTTLEYQGNRQWADHAGNYYNVSAWQHLPESYQQKVSPSRKEGRNGKKQNKI
ncbi:hypothetical protein LK494_03050 [Anaerovorax odorimutans]|nr:hypothetical protein [Anaerovorax odorimutans]